MNTVKIFLDESGNGNPEDPLVVCGIAVEEDFIGEFEGRIRSAYYRVLARPFRNPEDRERFLRTGFHRSADLPEVGSDFTHLLSSTSIYKALIIATDRSSLDLPEVDQLVELYVRLGGVARRQFRQASKIDLVIEQNEPLRPRLHEISDRINSRRNSNGRRLPPVTISQANKSPESILAAADGLALIAAAWLKRQRDTNASRYEYRTYLETEAAISWFCSLEHGVLSTRRTRHTELPVASRRTVPGELPSSRTGAASVPLAIPHASASKQLLSTRSRAPQVMPRDLVSNVESFATHLHTDREDLERLADEVDCGLRFTVKHIHTGKRVRAVVRPNLQYGTISKELGRLLTGTMSYRPQPHVSGFVRGRGIRDNARAHLDRDCVLRFDLKDFFESIDRDRLVATLEADEMASPVATIVGRLAAPQGYLATGLSTSPHLSNVIFHDTDKDLIELSRGLGLTFTRYVDDLTFSGSIDDYKADQIRAVLRVHGWQINEHKTRFMRRGHSQYVTGLSVADRASPHAPRKLKRAMRWRLHVIEQQGYDTYMTEFGGNDLGHYPSHLRGVARYLVAQEPALGVAYFAKWDSVLPLPWYDEDEEYSDYY